MIYDEENSIRQAERVTARALKAMFECPGTQEDIDARTAYIIFKLVDSGVKCSKCKAQDSQSTHQVEGGQNYIFCSLCTSILEKNGTNNVALYMQDRDLDDEKWPFKMTFVEKNMLRARLKRAAGKSAWV